MPPLWLRKPPLLSLTSTLFRWRKAQRGESPTWRKPNLAKASRLMLQCRFSVECVCLLLERIQSNLHSHWLWVSRSRSQICPPPPTACHHHVSLIFASSSPQNDFFLLITVEAYLVMGKTLVAEHAVTVLARLPVPLPRLLCCRPCLTISLAVNLAAVLCAPSNSASCYTAACCSLSTVSIT